MTASVTRVEAVSTQIARYALYGSLPRRYESEHALILQTLVPTPAAAQLFIGGVDPPCPGMMSSYRSCSAENERQMRLRGATTSPTIVAVTERRMLLRPIRCTDPPSTVILEGLDANARF